VHVADPANSRILIWLNGSTNLTKIISDGLNLTYSLFVTINDDIYVDNGYYNHTVDKWAWNANTSVVAMDVSAACYSLFVDTNNSLYCSLYDYHQVIKTSLNSNLNISVVAGVGCPGITSTMLYKPQGIFVHINLSLYVADCGNDRIQLFEFEQPDGLTIIGNDAQKAIVLDCPSGIVLDDDGYLFIVDQLNNRIIELGPNGIRCLVGCSGVGSASYQLNSPQSMAFDSYGNIFVTDRDNNRIQKFILASNSCGKSDSR
jgi:hypothetical protein